MQRAQGGGMSNLRRSTGEAKLTIPVVKPKRCRSCAGMFTPNRPLQVVCGLECSARYAHAVTAKVNAKAAAKDKRETRAKRESLKSRSKWMAEAQAAFNAWVRAADEDGGCISCGATSGKMNAGHYRSVGSCPELRFERRNVHKQCERCNTYLHGNLLGYRAGLWARISDAELAWLEGPHPPKHYSIDDLKVIKALYKQKLKDITA
jgi:hypothetical protein